MVTICENCGDKGFSVALIYCNECQVYAVHRYCLDVLPATFEEYVTWFCVDCEPNVVKPPTLNYLSPLPARTSKCGTLLDINQETGALKRLKKKEKKKKKKKKKKDGEKRNMFNESLACKKAHLNEDSCDEVRTSLPDNDPSNILEDNLSCHPGSTSDCDTSNVVEETSFIKCLKKKRKHEKKRETVVEAAANLKEHAHDGSLSLPLLEVHSSENGEDENIMRECKSDGGRSNDEVKSVKVKTIANSDCRSICVDDVQRNNVKKRKKKKKKTSESITGLLNNSKIHVRGSSEIDVHSTENHEIDEKLARERAPDGNSYNEEAKSATVIARSDFSVIPKDSFIVQAQPIIDPIWRGSLLLCNHGVSTVSSMAAHLSSLACSKVYEEAKLLPELLYFELLPRTEVWPKKFTRWGPSDDSIALYFFPEKSVEQIFDVLVHHMNYDDLAMKAIVRNAELLLFTSNILPLHFRKFREKLYLWGVFRGKQASHLAEVRNKENNLMKTRNWCLYSPVSPLGDSGEYVSDPLYSPVHPSIA